jgi:hypothetical protein
LFLRVVGRLHYHIFNHTNNYALFLGPTRSISPNGFLRPYILPQLHYTITAEESVSICAEKSVLAQTASRLFYHSQ